MALVEQKDFASPDDVMNFELGRIEILKMADGGVGRFILQPGWQWSKHEKPIVGTDLCEIPHYLYVVQGRLRVRMADGQEMDVGPGSVARLPAGHDAWVVGDEALVGVDWHGVSVRSKV